MASVGLLGFIKGVSSTIEEEYKRQNEEAADIRKEGRAEERAMRAEERRRIAERQAAEYRKKLDLKYIPEEMRAKALANKGLIEEDIHPDLVTDRARAQEEADRIRDGNDPTRLRAEAEEEYRAERAAEGTLSDITIADQKRLSADAAARLDDAVRQGRAPDLSDIDEKGPLYGTGTTSPRGGSDISFSISEVTRQLNSDLSAVHDIDIGGVKKRIGSPGGSRLQELRNGLPIAEILKDPESSKELRDEIAYKIHNAQEKPLKEAANADQISSLDQVAEVGALIADRADRTMEALGQLQKRISEGADPTQELTWIREGLAEAYGEPEEESKQSVAFRQMFAAFKASVNNKK